ncbi:MAG: hypothetical protein IPK26_23390 [Planctomycetes bacterium]|nr:hypothetical protein [Planctomycetota bacterium]
MRIIVPLAAALLIAPLSAQRSPGKPSETTNFTFQTKSFGSTAIGADAKYGIYLPKGYDDKENEKKTWPLVIWLHGMWEDHMRFATRGGAPVLDAAVTDGKLPPCIFVLADGGRTSMYVNRGDGKNFEDLISKDLFSHITLNYRVTDDRQQRALMGISMGGMAAMRIAFHNPEMFGTVAVHSSAVFPLDPQQLPPRLMQAAKQFGLDEVFGDPIDKDKWAACNPLGIAQKLERKDLRGLRIYFDAGTDDRFNFAKGNGELHGVLDEKKIEHTWNLVKGGGHAWGSGFQDESLLTSLAFVGETFTMAGAKGSGLKGLDGILGGDKGDGDKKEGGDGKGGTGGK